MLQVARADFQAAIHKGIVAGLNSERKPLNIPQAIALYNVGLYANKVNENFCGCPLTLAGIYKRDEGQYWPGTGIYEFVDGYDRAMDSLLLGLRRDRDGGYFEVV